MTREEALRRVKGYLTDIIPAKDYSEVEEIIKALAQEPCEDAISRQAALGCCRNEWEEEVEIRLKSLPPVTSQQKYEDIAKAFQLGLALGFGKKHDEMDKVIDEIKKVITPQGKQGGEQK